MVLNITAISPDETEAVLAVYRRAIRSISFPEYEPEILSELANRSANDFDRLALTRSRYVAKMDGAIVGYTGLDFKQAILTECYVAPESFGKSIGSALVKRVEAEALKAEIRHLTVLSSLNAVEFYKRNGFQEKAESYLPMDNGLRMRCMSLEKDVSSIGLLTSS